MCELDYRYIARLKVEATTPLFVGSGGASLTIDSLVMKDHNGLPMIPGTSLTGVLRHVLEDFPSDDINWKDVFGFQGKENEGLGSRLIISNASLVLNEGKVAEGISNEIPSNIQRKFESLPTRQHVRITHKGVAADKGLFDNEVVYAGARFIFEVELKGTEKDINSWNKLIEKIKSSSFRIGQGTRSGYGNLKVIGINEQQFNLKDENDFQEYLDYHPSFNAYEIANLEEVNTQNEESADYSLILKPDDFFIFSEGFGDAEVDNKPVTEEVIVYENGEINFVEKTLIPASSIKGAIAHRVAYHYNKLNGFFADKINDQVKKYIEENNQAVATIFGKKGEVVDNENTGQRGILIIDDLYYDDIDNEKIFNHVAIDRFTGGGIDGALFSEKVSHKKNGTIDLKINLSEAIDDDKIKEALEESLKDICKGLLPLGGMTTKGHGMFTGILFKKGQEIFDYNQEKAEAQ